MTGLPCTYRGCTTAPRWRIEPPNPCRAPWLACDAHRDAMVKGLSIGAASDLGASAQPLEEQ